MNIQTLPNVSFAMLLGNEAMGRGLVEAGCHFVTSYPGTPSSEILPAVIDYKNQEQLNIFTHWAVNEKIAFDEALAASWTGKRAAVIMKQVGLNVAADSLMSAAYTGVKGGLVIISADDPGPHSSQTEQDSRLFALLAKVPALDPTHPREAMEMLSAAFELSETYEIPVLVRPTLRVCHARTKVPLSPVKTIPRQADFQSDPQRWAATPVFRYRLHQQLNEKLSRIEQDFETSPFNAVFPAGPNPMDWGIIAGGVSFAAVRDLLTELDLQTQVDLLKIGTPYPLPRNLVNTFVQAHRQILVLEEPDYAVEIQLADRTKVYGRLEGSVPSEGELTPEVIYRVLSTLLGDRMTQQTEDTPWLAELDTLVKELHVPARCPTLCPGCGHRAAFFAIKKAFPRAIFPSDIGCYTLGINLKAVDTVLDMGAGLTIASGLYHAYKQDAGEMPTIIATMGDSTFFHAGVTGLLDAVYSDARYLFILLDNRITAMTGMQPTPELGVLADGSAGKAIDLAGLVQGCGVKFIRCLDPYQIDEMVHCVREADEFTRKEDGGMAVIIARHPCVIAYREQISISPGKVQINERCNGCRYCMTKLECPALIYQAGVVAIDPRLCNHCGVCLEACPKKAIEFDGR